MGFRSFRGTHPLSSCSALRVAWFLKIDPGTVSPRSKFEFSSCSRRSHENSQKIQEISNLGENLNQRPEKPEVSGNSACRGLLSDQCPEFSA